MTEPKRHQIAELRFVGGRFEQNRNANALPIWEVIAKISETIPDEEWDKLPTDLARNLDHYLYDIQEEQP